MPPVARARASPTAIARPMPGAPPVTRATRPVRSTRTVASWLPDHQRRALAEEAERDHERAAERRLGGERILGDDRRKAPVLEGRRAREQLHGARRGSQICMGLLHPEAPRRLGAGAEDPRERPGLGPIA